MVNTRLSRFVSFRLVDLYRGTRKKVKVSTLYRVEFQYYTSNRPATFYAYNVAIGVYWYLFDLLKLSHKYQIGIPRKELIELMKECRRLRR